MVEALQPAAGGVYLDGTLGSGGYAEAILEASEPDGRVIGLDLDLEAVQRATIRLERYGERFSAVHGGFHHAAEILAAHGIHALDGAVLDLGLSSEQVDDTQRGFSFRFRSPLDMRFDRSSGETAIAYLSNLSTIQLEEILATYGEERYCRKLATGIHDACKRGAVNTTEDLANLVGKLLRRRRGKINPATRTFQALRIALNRELENLQEALQQIPDLLKPRGRFCVVSYHSLEDRQVKLSFRERKKEHARWLVLTPRPVRPSADEIKANPRARSARMRVLAAGDASGRA